MSRVPAVCARDAGRPGRRSAQCIVALGAVALRALIPAGLTLTGARGATLDHPSGARLIATFHPSAALRAPDPSRRDEIVEAIRGDLRRALAEVDLEPTAR